MEWVLFILFMKGGEAVEQEFHYGYESYEACAEDGSMGSPLFLEAEETAMRIKADFVGVFCVDIPDRGEGSDEHDEG